MSPEVDPPPEKPTEEAAAAGQGGASRSGVRARMTGVAERAYARSEDLRRRAEARIAEEERSSRKGVAFEWFARYRDSQGQLNSVLLAAYLFLTFLPAMVVIATYVSRDPHVVATRMIGRLNLDGATARLVRDVLTGAADEKLVATAIAVVSVVIFGLGIGQSLQLVYSRVWHLPEPKVRLTENVRYFIWLTVLVLGGALYVIELALLKGAGSSSEWAFAPVWIAGLVVFLTWTPVFLLHRQITWREALPGALLTSAGLLGVRLVSSIVFTNWLNWYGKYYGGIGIAIALLFWIALITTVIIVGSAFAPAYAGRRAARAAGPTPREGT
jgi:membrane protein